MGNELNRGQQHTISVSLASIASRARRTACCPGKVHYYRSPTNNMFNTYLAYRTMRSSGDQGRPTEKMRTAYQIREIPEKI